MEKSLNKKQIIKPKTINEHEQVQADLGVKEKEEHERIQVEKAIEVMDRYSKDNEFIRNALKER